MILDGQEATKAKLESIETNQVAQKTILKDLTGRISSLETWVSRLTRLEAVVTECKNSYGEQEHVVQALLTKVDGLENRARRCNLIFYGIQDDNDHES